MSIFKRSEMSLILLGAGLVTLIVYFVFFRPSSDAPITMPVENTAMASLERKIASLDQQIKSMGTPSENSAGAAAARPPSLDAYQARVERVEAALSVKFDILTKRIGNLETKLASIEKSLKSMPAASSSQASATVSAAKPSSEGQSSDTGSKTAEQSNTGVKYHTVEKGDTLFGISRMYNTSISTLRQLNNMSSSSRIYPGDTLIVRQ